ncbi:hypothetical protein TBLA_0B07210 [Henningerozyma blattae CBS 6284]|uniref:Amino acid transporter transmembrane domain-containing protein n=1 Tax=Henningerozyma blattae (strain ATCC 34711 / CBS 6284 / DSM 70876 / NBRC 10599 / NRRL Y-10934 / UCD 77-7) TaxID=1071380 RepID=I2GZI6_HENB6|nr:hypothetical protein TBLA_0B07210 [Tetrapisispora blattae CBS 6284]CCH59538.1 hypothetical protein TBLA_0B07210 [Tetrapisispora blattae CBS 6284]
MTTATASIHSSIINLTKTIVGAGMLAIPFAFRNDGILVGILLTLLAAITSGFGLFVLAKCSKTLINPRNSSFFQLTMIAFPNLSPLSDISMIVQCFGVGLSYIVLIGDLFPTIFNNYGSRNFYILTSTIVIVPLCLLKRLDHLKYSSIVGLFALSYLSFLIVFVFIKDIILTNNLPPFERGSINWVSIYDFNGLLSTFTIIIFAYTGSMNLFTIINELNYNDIDSIKIVINHSIAISTIIFLIISIFGYLTFGTLTLGNIMLNYNYSNSLYIILGKLALGIMVILTFPLLFHPLRIACNNIIVWIILKYTGKKLHTTNVQTPIILRIDDQENESLLNSTDSLEQFHQSTTKSSTHTSSPLQNSSTYGSFHNDIEPNLENHLTTVYSRVSQESLRDECPALRFYTISAFLLISMFSIALNIKSFALVLSLVGATGSTSISFILPGLLGYILIGRDKISRCEQLSTSDICYKRLSLVLMVFGILVMFLSLYTTLVFDYN